MVERNPVKICELVYDGKLLILNKYSVSKDGAVRRICNGNGTWANRIMQGFINKDGYRAVSLYTDEGRKIRPPIHRLIAHMFLGPCPEGKEINHKDGNKLNNNWTNLEYLTHVGNIKHAYKTGLSCSKGINNPSSVLTEGKVRRIRRLLKKGLGYARIAKAFSVSESAIYKISRGWTWSHI